MIRTRIRASGISAAKTVVITGDVHANFVRNVPHLRFSDNRHGYVRCTLTPDLWRTDYRVIPTVIGADDGGISTLASFVIEKGRAAAQLV